jgi:hypothetical protein
MSRYSSPHDEPWYSDPDEPWGGSRKKREIDPDDERDRQIERRLDKIADGYAFLEASIRTCKACGMTARIRDGKHDGCVNGWIRDEIKAILELMPSTDRRGRI